MNMHRTVPLYTTAITADISDADFRTYAIICQLAWRNNPESEQPHIELTHQELASHHPGSATPSVNTFVSVLVGWQRRV